MSHDQEVRGRARIRDPGITPGVLPPGPLNAITDVAGVRVGHVSLVEGEDMRTGVTVILPHGPRYPAICYAPALDDVCVPGEYSYA